MYEKSLKFCSSLFKDIFFSNSTHRCGEPGRDSVAGYVEVLEIRVVYGAEDLGAVVHGHEEDSGPAPEDVQIELVGVSGLRQLLADQ